jgi:hypothetical protein
MDEELRVKSLELSSSSTVRRTFITKADNAMQRSHT